LLAPVFVGLTVKFLNEYMDTEDFNYTYENSPFTSFFGFFVIFWAVAFYQSWRKFENRMAIEWRSFGEAYNKNKRVKMSKFTDESVKP